MPSVRGVRFDPNREGLAGLRDCLLLTEAHPLERIPGWHYVSARRTKMSKEEKGEGGRRGDGWGSATLWLGTWSSLSLQLTGAIGFRASLHSRSISLPFFLLCPFLLSLHHFLYPRPPHPIYTRTQTHTQSLFLTVIQAAHLQCFQERQIKRGFSYRSVTLELRASWITINSIKQHSLCFAPSPATTQGGCPCHC